MDVKKIIQALINFGIPLSKIAAGVRRDPSTIGHWVKGQTNISKKLEADLVEYIKNIQIEFNAIFSQDER